jgi:hypothetical protein
VKFPNGEAAEPIDSERVLAVEQMQPTRRGTPFEVIADPPVKIGNMLVDIGLGGIGKPDEVLSNDLGLLDDELTSLRSKGVIG